MRKSITSIIIFIFLSIISFMNVSANNPVGASGGGIVSNAATGGGNATIYCSGDECGLQKGIDAVKGGVTELETTRSASQFIQDIVRYILTFVSLIAILYIIYAGFMILIGNGEEEKLKKSKQTILYVIIGMAVIWLAWPITNFIISILSAGS